MGETIIPDPIQEQVIPDPLPASSSFTPDLSNFPRTAYGLSSAARMNRPTGIDPSESPQNWLQRYATGAGASLAGIGQNFMQMLPHQEQVDPNNPPSLQKELQSAKAMFSPIKRIFEDPAAAAGELTPPALLAWLTEKAGAASPSPATTQGRLLTASGDVSGETLKNLRTAEPILEAAKNSTPPATLSGMPEFLNRSSQAIENQIAGMAQRNAGANVIAHTNRIAQAVRREFDAFPESSTGAILVPKGTKVSISALADKIEKISTLEDLDKLRNQLNGELQTYMKKNNFDQEAILRDPAKGFKMRALEQVRDAIADTLSNPIYGAADIRNLRSQQAALMNLQRVFKPAAENAEAQSVSMSNLPFRQRLFQMGAKAVGTVVQPKRTAAEVLTRPATADALVRAAFHKRPGTELGLAAGAMAQSENK